MNANQAAWEETEFSEIAEFMRRSGEAAVRSLGIVPAMRVLDLGCGDGTTAIPIALMGAEVVGIDIARNLVAAAKRRAAEAGVHNLQILHGDACSLDGVADHSFDLTLSFFGAMYAPNPFDVAREMVRVTKPGGRIVMGNWIPEQSSFIQQLRNITASFLAPTTTAPVSPLAWGEEANVIDRFSKAGVIPEKIVIVKDTYDFASRDKSPADLADAFTRFYEPTFAAAQISDQLAEFRSRLYELSTALNRDENAATRVPIDYLRVTVGL